MQSDQDVLAFADRFVGAIQSGDTDTVRACYAPDAKLWHNTDGIEQTVDQNMKVLDWFIRTLPDRNYRVVRREALSDGFLQQHVLSGVRRDGPRVSLPAALLCRLRDGKIARLDEYLDSAHVTRFRSGA